REVEPGEQGRVRLGEGREEQRAAGDQEDLVPVPDRSDRLQDGAAGAVAAPPEGADVHLHPEVEALEHEVAQEEERDEEEPQGLEPGRLERSEERRVGKEWRWGGRPAG